MSESADARSWGVQLRIWAVGLAFALVMSVAGIRIAEFASPERQAPGIDFAAIETASIATRRADIVDRRGAPLVGLATTYSLYLDSRFLPLPEDRAEAAAAIAQLFPEWDPIKLLRALDGRSTVAIRRRATPLEAQEAMDLGVAGLYRSERLDRAYFSGRATAHVVGSADIDGVGLTGVEKFFDERLRQAGAEPLRLSIDLRVQHRVRRLLGEAMVRYEAKAAAAVVMAVDTGEVFAMVSLPDFDPHQRPEAGPDRKEDSPRFHWAISTGYEPGSVMKIATWALALEERVGEWGQVWRAGKSIIVDKRPISDKRAFGEITFQHAFAKSSNVISARMALEVGAERQRAFFAALGLNEASSIELPEARQAHPVWHSASRWRRSSTATTSFGHGVQLSTLQVAEMAASLVNGGERVRATLIADKPLPVYRERVVRQSVSHEMRRLLRLAASPVGTGAKASVEGLDVGGKTGTAQKVIDGKYSGDKVVSSFVGVFPMRKPEFVVVIMLDEPSVRLEDGAISHYASQTAAPTAGKVIKAIAPLLGVEPIKTGRAD